MLLTRAASFFAKMSLRMGPGLLAPCASGKCSLSPLPTRSVFEEGRLFSSPPLGCELLLAFTPSGLATLAPDRFLLGV